MMSQRRVAKALGLSRTWVQVIERRALAKLVKEHGLPAKPRPKWLRNEDPKTAKPSPRCGHCGELGHNRRGCVADRATS
jgi:hypothetical protein